ncbi:tRNA (guanosine(46)-N7)-methyltransferase TrmB [Fodinibius halophilus]|uniref:tRNA (guanine-N(7)-)-methyltransferase n=1 Tax=Fodinibius halophilus TaxID=1736908 RepID=A0A6M1TC90_9BACT|nr:tRNA (guanosine(46)-N7)-methyltransferase TrmB [Fodinibius halophilus]NGP89983.1 tRNA (guanosine(46)-N7)-methyltransferase TrmB [Fodinibius halophilus]
MGTNKLQRFKEISEYHNVLELTDFQDDESQKPQGRWHSDVFGNANPIILELACGKGTYTLELARRNPDANIIGIDIKGGRIWKGATRALEEGLENVRFLRMYIDHLYEYFAPQEVDDIWITFPDPYPRAGDRNKRLVAPKFLNIYQRVLKPDGNVRLKTDSDKLFSYAKRTIDKTGCRVIDSVESIYDERPEDEILTVKTDFEKKHLEKGQTISFISFDLPEEQILD